MNSARLCPTCRRSLDGDTAFCPYDGTPLAHMDQKATDPMLGMVVDGRYRLLAGVGLGGMAAVYRAHSIALGEDVALKVLRQELTHNQRSLIRFAREARAASRIAHENVVRVLDFGFASGQGFYFLVMELLEGSSLRDVMAREAPLPLVRGLSILVRVAAGLGCAHELGVVHRDLKPANIMVTAGDRVKVVDFGLSRLADGTDPTVTNTGEVAGTPKYMSPEQCQRGNVDHRSDIYSFGIMAFEALAGRAPFGGTLLEQMHAHVSTPAPDVRSVRPDVPPTVAGVIARCLAKNAGDRFPTFGAVIDVLRPLAQRTTPDGGLFLSALVGDPMTALDPFSLAGLDDAGAIAQEITRLRRLRDRRLRELAAALWSGSPPVDVVGVQRDIARREADLEARSEAVCLADAQLSDAEQRARVGEADLRLSLVEASLQRAGMLDEAAMSSMSAPSLENAEQALASFRHRQESELSRLRHALSRVLRELATLEAELAPLYERLAQRVNAAVGRRADLRAHQEAFGQLDGAMASLQSRLEKLGERRGY